MGEAWETKSSALSEVEKSWVEKYCHLVCKGLTEAETSEIQTIKKR